jgi:hypothetical protein
MRPLDVVALDSPPSNDAVYPLPIFRTGEKVDPPLSEEKSQSVFSFR